MSINIGDRVVGGYGIKGQVVDIRHVGGRFRYQVGVDGPWLLYTQVTLDSESLPDPVQSPSHYALPGGIQVIDLIRGESFLRGNLIKYVFRAPHKGNELQDMKKAAEYLKWEIERLENE